MQETLENPLDIFLPHSSCKDNLFYLTEVDIFRQSAQSLMNSKDSAIGVFIKKLKGRKGAPVAIKAGARKIAIAFYNALTKGIDYVEQGAKQYAEQLEQREMRLLQKLAVKHKLYLVDYNGIAM